ncbi:putative ABC transport system permease protein [Brevibacterium siliguriense]|uniref:Putative ABC transport system permease protein n=1 Tax=Brevibacterium siliguriense TaxID=1136497 RepID=A0A1H1Y236_9MICO|nr:FtsX-like permease family protein [Brevibacterium siliguriense]SDT15066.1 putative ABC transport system permease protein [Brevibacterium siliguriense]
MIRIAWSNLRSAYGRLSAAMIAIAVSVAFIVAALLFSQAFGDTLRNQVRAEWAGADVAVTAAASEDPNAAADEDSPLTDSMRQTVADVDGVESAQLTESAFVAVSAGSTSVTGSATNLPQGQTETIDGTAPDSDDELMLREADAKTLGVGVGDSITLAEFDGARRSADGPSFTVSGIMPGSSSAGMNLYLTDDGLATAPGELVPDSIRIVADDGSDRTALAEAVKSALDDAGAGKGVSVRTVDQVVEEQIKSLSNTSDMLSTVGIAFGLLAAGVAALVISNTFNVLVASRTRVLALFRAIGASRSQVRGAAVVESFSLGIMGSVLGVGLGLLIGWGLSTVVRAFWMPEFAQMSPSVSAFVVGPVVGILVTLAAGLIPAIRASRVSPIEALRPVDVPDASPRIRWVRLTLSLVLGIGGIGLCLLGTMSQSVLFGIVGCFALFVALLVGAKVFVPPLVALFATAVGLMTRRSPAVKLAGRSASTAGGRTASTTGALLIGITLVTAVVVGSSSLQRTLELATAEDTPVDLVVSTAGHSDVDGEKIASVLDDSPIVEERENVPAPNASVSVGGTDGAGDVAITSAEAAADSPVLRSDGYEVDEGTLVIDPRSVGLDEAETDIDGRTATVRLGDQDLDLTIETSYDVPAGTALVSGADAKTLEAAAGDDVAEQTWAKIADDASSPQIEALTSELDAVGASGDAAAAQYRAEFASLFQVALSVVLGLLAAAVVIAVIGVSNTLTLSVIERRREGALLRALGFTRAAMSRMITIESLLMTLIALIVGAGVGTFFGWVGTASMMPASANPVLSVPWTQIGLIGVAAVLAAVLASAIPARSMSRIAPAKGMSME